MAVDWVGKGIGKIARGITGLKPVVIEWTNWKEGDIVWKYPEEVIPWGSVVVVKEMEAAIFYRDGKVYGLLKAGRHVLDTANVPFLKGLVEGLYGTSIFRCMVIFVSLRRFDGKFGGQTQTIELAPLKFHGKFYFRVTDPVLFVNKVVGPQNLFTTEELSEYLRGYFNSKIMAYLSRFSLRDVFYRQLDVQEKVMMQLKSDFKELGLDLEKVVFEGLETTEQWRKTLFWVQTTAAVPTAPYVLQMQTAKEVAKELGKSPGAALGAGMMLIPPLFTTPPYAPPTAPTMVAGVCPYCGKQVPRGASYCPYCGKKLKWCSKGHIVPADASYCPYCGEKLS